MMWQAYGEESQKERDWNEVDREKHGVESRDRVNHTARN